MVTFAQEIRKGVTVLNAREKDKENQVLIDVREVLEKSDRMLYMDEIVKLSGWRVHSVRTWIQKIEGLQKTNHIPKQYGLGVKEF